MSTAATIAAICASGGLSVAGFAAAAALPQASGDVPWKDLATGGAALLMLVAFVLFLRFLSEERKDRGTERADANAMVKGVTEKFAETTTTIHRECRESSERREQELHALLREVRKIG